jgi:glycosyltransferase involved in cell wall biosynthesis
MPDHCASGQPLVGRRRLRHSSGGMAAMRVALDLTTLQPSTSERWRDVLPIRFAAALIQHLPDVDFSVIARSGGHQGLACLDGPNVSHLALPEPNLLDAVVARLDARLPGRYRRARLAHRFGSMRSLRPALGSMRPSVLSKIRADVVFCPFTNSTIGHPAVPLVAAVHDLQHLSHPYLLGSAERGERDRAFVATARRAHAVVCATPSVRDVARQSAGLSAERVVSVAPGRLLAARPQAGPAIAATLARHRLSHKDFLLLVADFEPRHNQRVALTALSMVQARHPASTPRLVCVGGPATARASFTAIADRMGLGSVTRFFGPLDRDETTALIQASRAVIDPALYETVGESVLQALQLGRPVLCSDIPGLAELSGGAALTFDPHRPADLAALFERIELEPGLLESLAALARQQVATLASAESVAQRYWDVFRKARAACPASR